MKILVFIIWFATSLVHAQNLRTPEAYLISKIAKKQINPQKINQEFNFQNKNYKVSDFDNVVGANIQNVFATLSREDAKQYAQNYIVAKTEILNEKQPSPKKTVVLNNLNEMFSYIYAEKGPIELAKLINCEPEDQLTPIENILSKLESSKIVENCKQLEPGEGKVFVQDPADQYGTGDYLLKRNKDGNYQAFLNVKFKMGTGTGAVTAALMMAKSKTCLAAASQALKGPNGTKLMLAVFTPEEIKQLPADQRPKEKEITIEAPDFATDAASYAENINCGTILHEMLHLLGLCDEYKEDRAKYGDQWNCRVVTTTPSIMRDTEFFEKAVTQNLSCDCNSNPCKAVMTSSDENMKKIFLRQSQYDVVDHQFRTANCTIEPVSARAGPPKELNKSMLLIKDSELSFVLEVRKFFSESTPPYYSLHRDHFSCACRAGDRDCLTKKKNILQIVSKNLPKNGCPLFTKLISRNFDLSKSNPGLSNGILQIQTVPIADSLLQPMHFNKILTGPCRGAADNYNECASFAYKGSKTGACNVPEKCKNDKYFLGSPQ